LNVNESAINALGISVAGVPSGNLGADGTITLTLTSDTPNSVTFQDYKDAVAEIAFDNNSDDPDTTDRTLTFVANDGDSDSATESLVIKVHEIDDAPVVSVTADSPAWTEGGSAVSLFSSTSIDPVEAGETISSMTFSVDGLANGSDERLIVDGQSIRLTDLFSATTTANGYSVDVSVTGATATVTITKSGGYSSTDAETLVDTIAYDNVSDAPSGAARVVTFQTVSDSDLDGVNDTTTNGTASLVTISAVNDAAVVVTQSDLDDASNEVINFEGGDDTIALSGLPVNTEAGTEVTVEFWMNWNGSAGQMPFGFSGYDLYFAGSSFGFNTASGDIFGISTTGLSGGWHHVAAVFHNGDATQSRLIIDGVEQTMSQQVGSPNQSNAFVTSNASISGWPINTSYRFDGMLDEVRIWNDGRTADEVRATMHDSIKGAQPNLVASYSFTGATTGADGVTDDSGNGHHGTMSGMSVANVTMSHGFASFGDTLAYTENDSATVLHANISLVDYDDTDLEGATIQISGNFQSGADELGFTTQNGITGVFSGDTLTLTGTATVAEYEAALRSITYENTSDDPSTATRTISWSVDDGDNSSVVQTSSIDVTAVNDAATVATNAGVTVAESGSTIITNAMLNEGDPDDSGAGVIYRMRGDFNQGALIVNGVALEKEDTFTQADIDAGLVVLHSSGAQDSVETLRLAINDGGEDGTGETNINFIVTFTDTNDAPVGADDPAGTATNLAADPDTVGFWRFGESSGTTAVDESGSNNGTYNNVTLGATGVTGGNTAADFNGTNSYVDLGNLDVAGSGITMAAWINVDNFGGGDGRIFGKSDGVFSPDHTWMLSTYDEGADNYLRFRLSAGGYTETLIANTATSMATGQWYHVAATYDAATGDMALYLNGEQVDFARHTVGGAVDQDPSRNVWIGGNPSGGNYLDGRIDEALLMERSMSASEIAALAELSAPDYSVTEASTLTVNAANGLLQNDSDADGDSLTVAEVNGVAGNVGSQFAIGDGGLLTVNSDGSFDFDTNGQYDDLAGGATFTETFSYTVSDGNGGTDTATAQITINGENDAPTITDLAGDTVNYTEGDGAVVIEQGGDALVADIDSANFDGGNLNVFFFSGDDDAEDVLAIRNQGTGAGQMGVSGTDVTYEGTVIGTFVGGSAGANLVISFDADATPAAVSALIQNITYENTSANNPTTGTRNIHFRVDDGDGNQSISHVTQVNVANTNDAPTLDNSGDLTLPSITEDDVNNGGRTVAQILASDSGTPFDDVDGDPEGIAITVRNNGRGIWEFSTDGGTNWGSVGTVSETEALLLRSTDLVRFNPNGENAPTTDPTFEFRAWDGTSGAAGTKVDVSTNGGTTAFSSTTETASISVTDVNDAPVLDNSGTIALGSQSEDAGAPSGAVGTVITDLVQTGGNVTDVDASSQTGVAISDADTTNGSWWYTTDGGTNWNALGSVSDSAARVLNANSNTRIYFQSDADFNGTVSDAITFRAWDRSVGSNGSMQDASTNGGTTAFSSATET
ncbi:MAG: LamG-like jellyroll fold domain-containing protein, partial [Pirellulaceae bacterium]